MPYPAWAISTVGLDGVETAFNFADLNNCSTRSSSLTSIQTDPFGEAYDSCFPSLQYNPDEIRTLQSEWATCVDVGGIIWDPPYAISSVTALIDPSITATDVSPSETSQAIAGGLPPSIRKATGLTADPLIPKVTSVHSTSTTWSSNNDPSTPSTPSTTSGLPNEPWILSSNLLHKSSNGPESVLPEATPDSLIVISRVQTTQVITSSGASIVNLASGYPVLNPNPSRVTLEGQTINVPPVGATSVAIGTALLNPQILQSQSQALRSL